MTPPMLGRALVAAELGPGVRAFVTTVRSPDAADDEPFNLALTVGDDPARVRERRRVLAAVAGAPVAFAHQVHGRAVLVVDGPLAGRGDDVGQGDVLVTARADVALGVLAADCVPVLLAHAPVQGPALVAAAHVGRVGLVTGAVEAALGALVSRRAALADVRAVVGPAVCGSCYEVPAALQAEVEAAVPGSAGTTRAGTPGLDLPGSVSRILRAHGVEVARVGGCTLEDPRWFSHRAVGGGAVDRPVGRLAAVVRMLDDDAGVSPQEVERAGLA